MDGIVSVALWLGPYANFFLFVTCSFLRTRLPPAA
jgi:hypothetical protein